MQAAEVAFGTTVLANARLLAAWPEPITDPDRLAQMKIHRRDCLGGILDDCEHAA
jgi:hypothetical protein